MEKIGLYIHIPFCAAKCDYCDFLSFAENLEKTSIWEAYKNALIREWSTHKGLYKTDTVYIGGGTPTVWPSILLRELLAAIGECAGEYTCEANPGTLTVEKLAVLREGGVNRLSLGLQVWQDTLLEAIGRKTACKDFKQNFRAAREAGFTNINVDVMFGLPGQTLTDWEETLQNLCALRPEHISAYSLTPEEGTPLFERLSGSYITDEETDRTLYAFCKKYLEKKGYAQYELSNFSQKGCEAQHNSKYWTRKPYLGLGLGAHSFIGNKRWHNTRDLSSYLKGLNTIQKEEITPSDAMAETMFLGLRLCKGVSYVDFEARFGLSPEAAYGPWILKMVQENLLCIENGYLRLTHRGMDIANYVMAGFLS